MSRVQVALEAWLDRFPSTTRLRFGEDPDTKTYVLCENMHGPRMDVMTREEYRSFRSTADREDYLKGDRIALEAKGKAAIMAAEKAEKLYRSTLFPYLSGDN